MSVHSRREGNGFSHQVTLQRHQPTNVALHFVQGIKALHEFDDYANHRLFIDKRWSEWATYQSFSFLKYGQGIIAARTEYWDGDPLFDSLPKVFMIFRP